jgi:hypothetical protein
MKTCVIAMPRTASKTVMHYLSSYYREKYKKISYISYIEDEMIVRDTSSLEEFLNYQHPSWFVHTVIQIDPYEIFMSRIKIKSVIDELNHRMNIIRNLEYPYVIKHFPYDDIKYITTELLSLVDRTYYLIRPDIFEHSLSWELAIKTRSWINNPAQDKIIQDAKINPIVIDIDSYTIRLKELLEYNKKYERHDSTISVDQIKTINSSKDFCKVFNLEFIDFKFTKLPIEFGDNKKYMIANLDELHDIYSYLCP